MPTDVPGKSSMSSLDPPAENDPGPRDGLSFIRSAMPRALSSYPVDCVDNRRQSHDRGTRTHTGAREDRAQARDKRARELEMGSKDSFRPRTQLRRPTDVDTQKRRHERRAERARELKPRKDRGRTGTRERKRRRERMWRRVCMCVGERERERAFDLSSE